MYKSPIEMFMSDIQHQIEKQKDDEIYKAVVSVGINVDKEELLRALRYDRQQYEQGFLAGKAATMDAIVRCAECVSFRPYMEDRYSKGDCDHPGGLGKAVCPKDYCSCGERRNDLETPK